MDHIFKYPFPLRKEKQVDLQRYGNRDTIAPFYAPNASLKQQRCPRQSLRASVKTISSQSNQQPATAAERPAYLYCVSVGVVATSSAASASAAMVTV